MSNPDVRQVECPDCGALAGERCRGVRRKPRLSNHLSRIRAFGAVRVTTSPKRPSVRRRPRSTAYRLILESLMASQGELCALCDERIAEDAGNDGPSFDHIIPLARGGADALNNIQLAHLRCNKRKGAEMPQEAA